jgi:hypothetical protein
VARAAEALGSGAGSPVQVLTGVRLVDTASGQWVTLDLVALTSTAVVVGIESRPSAPNTTPPQAAALTVARLQRDRMIAPPLPVYAFWLGAVAPAGYSGAAPALAEPESVRRFVEQASSQGIPPAPEAAERLADVLLQANVAPAQLAGPDIGPPVNGGERPGERPEASSGGVWRQLRGLPARIDAGLRQRIRRRPREIRPADVRERLEAAMLAPENILEDARYHRVVPNDYVVGLHPAAYERHYRLIERRVCQQWQEELVEALTTANQRHGRRQYQFGGPVHVRIEADAAVPEGQVRIRAAIVAESDRAAGTLDACLELLGANRRWLLSASTLTIGRDEASDVHLPTPPGQQQPLISSQHAWVQVADGAPRLFDGSPTGRPSLNGTFVNGRRVTAGGHPLAEGDTIVLAPLDPEHPRPDAPGAVALRYHARCDG